MTIHGKIIHEAVGAGRWFPANEAECRNLIEGQLAAVDVQPAPGKVLGGISPHAGYLFCGAVMAHTFRAIQAALARGQSVDTVVVLGFSHRQPVDGVLLMDGHGLRTPLGTIPLDREGAAVMAHASHRITMGYGPHEGEHSAENQVPFVQAAIPGADLILGLVGDHSRATTEMLREAMLALADKKQILVIASTDLLHDSDYALVTRTDRHTLSMIEALDHEGLREAWTPDHQVCCDIGPVLATMALTRSMDGSARKLAYRNSGDDFPESRGHWVVGYGAVVFHT
jgi:AmmeMemoRadiSam system protein B